MSRVAPTVHGANAERASPRAEAMTTAPPMAISATANRELPTPDRILRRSLVPPDNRASKPTR
jgi:hypothetical protein